MLFMATFHRPQTSCHLFSNNLYKSNKIDYEIFFANHPILYLRLTQATIVRSTRETGNINVTEIKVGKYL